MTEPLQPSPLQADQPVARALEFAEYMAKGAEQFIEAALAMVNEYHEADDKGRDPDIAPHSQSFDEYLLSLRSDIYEFRKRRDRATPTPGKPDMLAICAALGFDPTNHHNAAKCPYCTPAPTPGERSELCEAADDALHAMVSENLIAPLGQDCLDAIEKLQRALVGERQPATPEATRRALNLALGALMQCSPCMEPECKADQSEWLQLAIADVQSALATPSPSPQAPQVEPPPFYISGPYPDGTYSVCEAATMRVLRFFRGYEDLQLAAGTKRMHHPRMGVDHLVTAEAPQVERLTDEQLDELARRFWSFDHYSFDHRAFARAALQGAQK